MSASAKRVARAHCERCNAQPASELLDFGRRASGVWRVCPRCAQQLARWEAKRERMLEREFASAISPSSPDSSE